LTKEAPSSSDEELTPTIFGVIALASIGRAMAAVIVVVVAVVVVLVVFVAFAAVVAAQGVALVGSNASPCAAGGKLHFRPSHPTLEQ